MKVSVEIKDDQIFYSYYIGKNKDSGKMDISVEAMCLIVDLMRALHKVFNAECDINTNIFRCTAYLEKHPEFVEEYIKSNSERLNKAELV